jgi:hypothetical protein
MNLGQQGLNPTTQNIYTQGQPGLLDSIGSGLGGAATGFLSGGPVGAGIGGLAGLLKGRGGEQKFNYGAG